MVVFFLSDTSPAFFRTWYRHEKNPQNCPVIHFRLVILISIQFDPQTKNKHPNNTYLQILYALQTQMKSVRKMREVMMQRAPRPMAALEFLVYSNSVELLLVET